MSSYTIPNVIAQHPRGERIMDVYSHLLSERIIYLGTAIDAGVANALIAQLLHLEVDKPEQEINLYINCEGGDMTAMLAIYDTMQHVRPDIATTCVGQAIGVGAVMLAAGAAGKRAVLPHARVDAGAEVYDPLGQQVRVDVHDAVAARMLRDDVRDRVAHAATSAAPSPRPAGRRRRGTTCAKSVTMPSMNP